MAKKRLPKPHKGRDLQPHEKIDIALAVCSMYAEGQYPIASCLAEYGVKSESTWAKWCSEIDEIAEAYKEAKDEVEQIIAKQKNEKKKRIVAASYDKLLECIEGYTITILEQEVIPGGTNESGQEIPQTVLKTKRKQVHVKPSPTLIMYALNNLEGETFTRNPEPYQKGNERMPDKIDIQIIGQTSPITSEDDIPDDIE